MINNISLYEAYKYSYTPSLIISGGPDFKIISANNSLLQTIKIEEKNILNRNYLDIFYELDNLLVKKIHREIKGVLDLVINTHHGQVAEIFFTKKDHDLETFLKIQINPMIDETGQLAQFYLQFTEPSDGLKTLLDGLKDISDSDYRPKTQANQKQQAIKFIKMVDKSLDVICTIDRNGLFQDISAASESVWGYKPSELKGKPYIDLVEPGEVEKTKSVAQAIISGDDQVNFENRYVTKDGRIIPVLWSAKWDEEDSLMYCVAKNISLRKDQENNLLISEQRFKKLVQDGSDLIAILDGEANYLYISPTSTSVLGMSPDENIGKNAFDFIHPEDQPWVYSYFSKLETDKVFSIPPYRFKNAKGDWRWIETVVKNLLDDADIQGIVANSRDVSDRIQHEIELKQSEEKYKLLFKHSPLSKIVYDVESLKIQDVNDTAIKLFGYSRDEFLNMSLSDVIFTKKLFITSGNNNKKLKPFSADVKTLSKKDGTQIHVALSTQEFLHHGNTSAILLCNDVTEKEVTLRKLKENETKLLAAQQIAKLGYWKLNLLTNELFWSDEVYNIWKKNKNTFTIHQDTFLDSVHPEDRDAFDEMLQQAMAGESGQDIEHRIVLDNGDIKWVHQRGNLIKNRIGEPVIFEGTVQDITERKLAEQELLISEARHRGLVESQTHYVIRVDLDGNYSFVNKKFTQDFGGLYKDQNVLGKSSLSYINEYHHQRTIDVVEKCILNPNQVYKVELDKSLSDKSTVTTLWDFICLTDPDGRPTEIQCMGMDITSRIKAERELQESKQRFEYAVQATSEAIWDWDLENNFVFRAPSFRRFFGDSIDSLDPYSEAWFTIIHPKDNKRVIQSIKTALGSYQKIWECEYRCKKENGAYIYVRDKGIIIRDEAGNLKRMVGAVKDISKEKTIELENKLKLDLRKVFSENLTLDQTYELTLQKILQYTELPFGEIWVTDYEQTHLFIATYHGSGIHISDEDKFTLKLNQGLPGYVWSKKTYLLIDNLQTSDLYIRKGFAKENRFESAIAYPIIFQEDVIGVMVLYNHKNIDQDIHFYPSNQVFDQIAIDIQRKKAEKELNLFFDLSPDLLCFAGFDGYFKKINRSFERVLGFTEEEVLKMTYAEFTHPDDLSPTLQTIEKLRDGNNITYFENRYLTSSGSYVWLAWTSAPMKKEGLIFAIAKDITEKKKQEHLLAASSKKVADTLESIQDGFYALDREWKITYWNNEAERLIGKKREQIIGNTIWEVFPETLNLKFHPQYNKVIQEQIPTRFEEFYPPLNMWIDTSVFPSEQGLTVYFKDVTDKKLSELELVQFKKVIESSKECIGILHQDKKAAYINPAFSEILGYEYDELIQNQNALDFNTDKELAISIYSEVFSGNHWQGDVELKNWQGQVVPFYLSAGPIYNDKGDIIAAFGIYNDISERKAAEKTLKELNETLTNQAKKLAVSNAELEQFAYVASHDLQEPLRMISSFLTQIKKKYDPLLDDKGKQYIHYAIDGAQRMKQIILDLLAYSRVGRLEEPLEAINLNELIAEIKALLKRQTEKSGAVIDYERLPVVQSIKTPLRHLFLNLIENGLKYQTEGNVPHIQITSTDHPSHWHFMVRDNGIGISPEYFEKIFVIFQRLHHKEEFAGSGMGLAICKKTVEYLGGKIWVESLEGKGSTFHFTISKFPPL